MLITPFVVYIGVLIYKKRDWKAREEWQGKTPVLLTIMGVTLAFIALFLFETNIHKGIAGETYLPARMENGVFKPAEWVKQK
jgi:amino acid transporter